MMNTEVLRPSRRIVSSCKEAKTLCAGRWALTNSSEQIQYYGNLSKVRRSLLSWDKDQGGSERDTELKPLDLRSPHEAGRRRQREMVSERAKMTSATLVGSGVVGVIGWRRGKSSGSEDWHMCPQVAERINDLLSSEGLSPVKCRCAGVRVFV